MQYILSELELQELQDKATAYDTICDYIDKTNINRDELHSCAIDVIEDIEALL